MPHAVVPRSAVCLFIALLLVGLSPVPPPAPEEGRDGPVAFALIAIELVAVQGLIGVKVVEVHSRLNGTKTTDGEEAPGEGQETDEGSPNEGSGGPGGEGTDPDADTDSDTDTVESSASETNTVVVPLGAEEGIPLAYSKSGPWYSLSHQGQATASTTSAQIAYESISASADVLQTEEDVREVSYLSEQTHTFRVERTQRRRGDTSEARLTLTMDEVRLSTIDVPDTYGHSILTMSVSVAGREVYSATASVAQAQEPVVSADFTYESIEAKPDLLILRGVEQTLDLKLPMKRTFDIEVTFRFEGVGQRL